MLRSTITKKDTFPGFDVDAVGDKHQPKETAQKQAKQSEQSLTSPW